jgi:hypothetical protein
LEWIGTVNSEGGPLLVADPGAARKWSGAEGEDYPSACEPFDADRSLEGLLIRLGSIEAIAWEMAGAGTADVFRTDDGFIVVRYWLKDQNSKSERLALAGMASNRMVALGRLPLTSGWVCILWAAIAGDDIALPEASAAHGVRRNSDGTSMAFELTPGTYDCSHDIVALEGAGRARRCRFRRLAAKPE